MDRQNHERIVRLNNLHDQLDKIEHWVTVVEFAAITPELDIGDSLSVVLLEVRKEMGLAKNAVAKMVEEMKGEGTTVELKAG